MIEKKAIACKYIVCFAIVFGYPICVLFNYAIRTSRRKRSQLVLSFIINPAASSLVEADKPWCAILSKASNTF